MRMHIKTAHSKLSKKKSPSEWNERYHKMYKGKSMHIMEAPLNNLWPSIKINKVEIQCANRLAHTQAMKHSRKSAVQIVYIWHLNRILTQCTMRWRSRHEIVFNLWRKKIQFHRFIILSICVHCTSYRADFVVFFGRSSSLYRKVNYSQEKY